MQNLNDIVKSLNVLKKDHEQKLEAYKTLLIIINEIPLKSLDETISYTHLEWVQWAKEQLGYVLSNNVMQSTGNDTGG